MKFAIFSLLAGLASALPTTDRPVAAPLQERQALFLGATRNDLVNGGACPQTIFIYARASGEGGNLGILGGPIGDGIQRAFGAGSVWVQGVGGAYTASLTGNLARDGTTRAAIAEMNRLFELADATCPEAQIVAGGYSQGTALAAATVSELDRRIRDKVAGVVLFGYTKNRQNGGGIPNYPDEKVRVFCNTGDLVCSGTLVVTASHFLYQTSARGPAVDFLVSRLRDA